MCKTNVRDIVCEWLEDSEFDGLVSDFDCGCLKSDLMPCGNPAANCEPAYRFDCARCSKAHCCHLHTESCGAWVMSGDKDFCEPDYMAAAPAVGSAAQNAALPACAPLTVGEVARAGLEPEWHAQDGFTEHVADGIKVEIGEVLVPLPMMIEAVKAAIDKVLVPKDTSAEAEKQLCQNTAKTDEETTWYPDVETALRHAKKSHLQLGA